LTIFKRILSSKQNAKSTFCDKT